MLIYADICIYDTIEFEHLEIDPRRREQLLPPGVSQA
jgi:hypothetical protein